VTAYEFDTTLDPEYPVLTRGNAGEIMPDVVSPLSATVFFPPLERGWRRSFTETWDVMDWPGCPTTFAPIVGGRFYINISAFRRLADLTPGTSPDDIDRTLFAAGGIRLDPYEAPDEEGYAERGERIAAATASLLEDPPLDRIQREHDAAQTRRVEGRSRRSSSSNEQLLDRFESMQPFMESDFVSLFIGSSVSPVVLGRCRRAWSTPTATRGTSSGVKRWLASEASSRPTPGRRSPRSPDSRATSSKRRSNGCWSGTDSAA
jgi:hypothetical protein